jgi:trimethyllysine dioxygenase
VLWTSQIASDPPTIEYDRIMDVDDERGVRDWLRLIVGSVPGAGAELLRIHNASFGQDTYGFAFVKGVPPTPEDTEKLVERMCVFGIHT